MNFLKWLKAELLFFVPRRRNPPGASNGEKAAGIVIPPMTIPVDQRNGKPLVTNAMKAACIGEFSFDRESVCPECFDAEDPDPDCRVCGGKVEFTEKITVPWTTCKEIYKAMAVEAAKA